MPISEYQKSILKARQIPIQQSASIQAKLEEAYRAAWLEIDTLLRQSQRRNTFSRQLWQAKQQRLSEILQLLGVDLKQSLTRAVRATAEETAFLRQDATNALLRESNQVGLFVDFADIPQGVVEALAAIQDVEGFKFSANVWGRTQQGLINRVVLRHAAVTTSVADIAKQLQPFVVGFADLSKEEKRLLRVGKPTTKAGMAIQHKTERLVRTEISNAAWEAGRRSAEASPIVEGIKWNLSNRHPKQDMCDFFSKSDLYGLGAGVYPNEKLSPRGHPNCFCFQTDVIREANKWSEPKASHDFKGLESMPFQIKGSDGYVKTQFERFRDLVLATEG